MAQRRRGELPTDPLRWLLVILLAAWSVGELRGQEIMAVNQVIVHSKKATLVSTDAEGTSHSEDPQSASAAGGRAAVSQVGPGGRIEVSGAGPAQMIISEAVTAHLEPGTQIELPEPEEGQKPAVSLKLLKGKMFIKVDAAKLKKEGNVEFRLETPKSLLAVKGTKFVVASGDIPDTVALLEGSVAVKDQATGKFAMLRPGQATEVTGAGELQVRRLNLEESAYHKVFEQSNLSFVSYEIDGGNIHSEMTILPPGKDRRDPENWIEKPKTYTGELVQFDGFSSKGLRLKYKPDALYLPSNLELNLWFKARQVEVAPEEVIGVLVRVRASEGVMPSMHFDLAIDETGIGEVTMSLGKTTPRLDSARWQAYLGPVQFSEASSPAQLEVWRRGFGGQVYMITSSWPNLATAPPFTLEIASIQVVTLTSEEE